MIGIEELIILEVAFRSFQGSIREKEMRRRSDLLALWLVFRGLGALLIVIWISDDWD